MYMYVYALLQMIGFLDTLCGAKASDLNVKDKDKYNFDPKKLLAQIASIILRVWTQESKNSTGGTERFLISFGTHPEFSQPVIDRWSNVLQKHNLLDPRSQKDYGFFLEEVGFLPEKKMFQKIPSPPALD